jgi:hypothetical protein
MKYIRMAVVAAACFAVAAGAALAQRPDTRQMSCGEVRNLIGDAGGIVLTTGRHTYDRYVASGFYCDRPYVSVPAYVDTREGQCPVLRCGNPIFDRDGF